MQLSYAFVLYGDFSATGQRVCGLLAENLGSGICIGCGQADKGTKCGKLLHPTTLSAEILGYQSNLIPEITLDILAEKLV